jgi:Tfp pilus assembly protein PilX
MNKQTRTSHNPQRGIVLISMVLIMLAMTFIMLGIATFTVNQFSRTNRGIQAVNDLLSAEAGAEESLYQLNQNNTFSGYGTEQTFFNDSVKGRATYQTTITPGSVGNEKIITSTGRLYQPAASTTPRLTRKVRLTVVGTTATGYSVQTGPGGLIMSNSATIANGDVYINGFLTMSNSAHIGSATNPVNVHVAHVNCPAGGGATYPTQCNSGQPITLNNTAHIYGSVYATNQTNGSGMSNPGLIANSTAPAISLPDYDRTAQKNAVTSTITSAAASCSNSQTRTWQANTHITGNVSISNSCVVTVLGNVWIDGTFTISNSSSIKVANSVTTTPVIMVDGSSASFSNSSAIIANSSNIGFEFITFYSSAACSPNCATVTGTDLFNTRNTTTINLANSSLGAGSTFYARWSKINLSNGGSVGAVLGQTIQLNNTGNISFGSQLSSGANVWSIKNYQQVF